MTLRPVCLAAAIPILLLAGTYPAAAQFEEFEHGRVRELRSAYRRQHQRQIQLNRCNEERAALVAFGAGTWNDKVTMAVRKHLRQFENAGDLAGILSQPAPAMPARDFRRHDRWWRLLGPEGELPPPPVVTAGDAAQRWRARTEGAWGECLNAIRDNRDPTAEQLAALRSDLVHWKDSETRLDDRRQRAAMDAYFRDVRTLADLLSERAKCRRLGIALCGFAGGRVSDFIEWVLDNGMSPHVGTSGLRLLADVSADLVRQFDRRGNRRSIAVETEDVVSEIPSGGLFDSPAPVPLGTPPLRKEESDTQ